MMRVASRYLDVIAYLQLDGREIGVMARTRRDFIKTTAAAGAMFGATTSFIV
jgi:hypothetical protein